MWMLGMFATRSFVLYIGTQSLTQRPVCVLRIRDRMYLLCGVRSIDTRSVSVMKRIPPRILVLVFWCFGA